MDEARHLDVFRKRALANGGGLLSSSGNDGLRVIIEAKDFTEMSAIMHVQGEGFVQSMFRMGEYIAHERRREAHLPAVRRRTSRATSASASCT